MSHKAISAIKTPMQTIRNILTSWSEMGHNSLLTEIFWRAVNLTSICHHANRSDELFAEMKTDDKFCLVLKMEDEKLSLAVYQCPLALILNHAEKITDVITFNTDNLATYRTVKTDLSLRIPSTTTEIILGFLSEINTFFLHNHRGEFEIPQFIDEFTDENPFKID